MTPDCLFLDVETPNYHNDRICSIGLVRTDAFGHELTSASFLVNPEVPFHERNMHITGICSCDVEDAPTFDVLWNESLRALFTGVRLVAHNARFDLSVLSKTLDAYNISSGEWMYSCTKELANYYCPNLANYRLPTVCKSLGVEMGKHHRAFDDARACCGIFWALADSTNDIDSFFHPYHFCNESAFRDSKRSFRQKLSDSTEAYKGFVKLCERIISNNEVSLDEAVLALIFIEKNRTYFDCDPTVHKIESILLDAVVDGDIDDAESNNLTALMTRLVNPASTSSDGKVEVAGHSFCLTGTFSHGERSYITHWIEAHGGVCLKSVTRKCDYVVVGEQGSEAWSTENYGGKVKKAMDYQAKGYLIEIIGESSLPF